MWLIFLRGFRTTVIEFLLTYASGSALNPPETSVAYFYCSFYDRDSLNTAFILGSLAFQLCEYKDEVYQKLLSHAGGNFSKTSSQIPHEELIKLMIEASAKRRRVVILIDGINECEDPPAVLEYLKTLVKNARCTLNLFISAINEKGIEQSLRDVPLITHKLQSTDIKSDVHRYIRERMESSSRLRIQSPQLKALIEWRLVHGVQGMSVGSHYPIVKDGITDLKSKVPLGPMPAR